MTGDWRSPPPAGKGTIRAKTVAGVAGMAVAIALITLGVASLQTGTRAPAAPSGPGLTVGCRGSADGYWGDVSADQRSGGPVTVTINNQFGTTGNFAYAVALRASDGTVVGVASKEAYVPANSTAQVTLGRADFTGDGVYSTCTIDGSAA